MPRRLLAALTAAGGKVVPDDRLVEALWGNDPPPKPAVAIQAYVSRLRSVFGPAYRDRLERTAAGYRLSADEVDADVFSALVESARDDLTAAKPDNARRQLVEALALWRGEPYAELPADLIEADRSRLVELRETAAEDLAAARLATGDAIGAVVSLEQLVREAPLRERRWALLVLGLYRGDRQGDALAALRKVRRLLAGELGVDPGPDLQELERQVLAQDPRLQLAEPPQAVRAVPIRRPLTSFRGREDELSLVTERLSTQRLVSLVGPAGVGKTRLAVEYVASTQLSDGPWFARLADVREPGEVAAAVADAIGLVAVEDDAAADVIRAVGDRPGVLVLDNCEHVVAAAADLVARLVEGCPRLRILATSREPLGVDGEVTVPVMPLPSATDSDAAVALLVDRVQAVRPGWLPTATELTAARRIAVALDGLPLAIELAAARARVLGLGEIADRLDDRFAVLGTVPRGSLAAHDTLEAAIGWSVDLLDEADRQLLLRLWAFEGGFTLEAAESAWPGSSGRSQVLESLSALVTRSVVVADTTVEPTRYLLLESIRAYCRQLDPDPETTLELQAAWVRVLAARCAESVRGAQAGWFMRMMSRELPNFRAGFAHDLARDPAAALATAVGLGVFLYRSVHHAEAIRVLRTALDAAPDAPALDRGRALNTLTALTYFSGDIDKTEELVHIVTELLPSVPDDGDPLDYAELWYFLAVGTAVVGDPDLAMEVTGKLISYAVEHELPGMVSAAQTVREVALLKVADAAVDLAALAEHVEILLRDSRGWNRGWANLAAAETYLRHPGLAPESGRLALVSLRLALTKFLEHEDYPYALNVLRVGALALARVGRPVSDAVRLLAAVRDHAERLGLRTPGLIEPGIPWVEDYLRRAAGPAYGGAGSPYGGAGLSWNAMVALFAED